MSATVAEAVTADSIPCNLLAGYHHDHLLAPVERADDAVGAITRLAAR